MPVTDRSLLVVVFVSVQNGGLALFPMIVAGLRTSFHSYAPWVEVFFSSLAGIGVLSGIVLYGVDRVQLNGKLEKPGGGAMDEDTSGSLQQQ